MSECTRRTRAPIRATSLAVVIALVLAACTSFHAVSLSSAHEELSPGDDVRVTTIEGQKLEFEIVSITAEAIAGDPGSFRFDQIAALERKRFSLLKTAGLYLVVSTVFLVLAIQSGSLFDFGSFS